MKKKQIDLAIKKPNVVMHKNNSFNFNDDKYENDKNFFEDTLVYMGAKRCEGFYPLVCCPVLYKVTYEIKNGVKLKYIKPCVA